MTSRKRSHGQCLKRRAGVGVVPLTEFFVLLVLGPVVGGPFVACLNDINEANFFQEVLETSSPLKGAIKLSSGFVQEPTPFIHGAVFFQGSIITTHDNIHILQFNVAARGNIPE
ncbi:hypothetical protein HG530_006909 [Fusarium avenaceum]|nr:hypothetical protein HG530_006909 [Fusarium avenaceum]